jgi:hypothetical protein
MTRWYSSLSLIKEIVMLSRFLTVLLILAFVGVFGDANIARASHIVQSGLVSYWSFDEGTIVGDTVKDVMNVNDGTIFGDFESVQGKFGQALKHEGVLTDYVQVASDVLSGATSITVWAMVETLNHTHYVFGHTTLPTWKDRVQIYCDTDGQLDIGLGDSHTRHTNIVPLEIGQWYHIGLVYTDTPDGDYRVYVDGQLKAEGSFTGINELMGFADIANDGAQTGRDEGWLGVIDEFCLYDRVLSRKEIEQNYLARGLAVADPSTKLSAVWGEIKTGY